MTSPTEPVFTPLGTLHMLTEIAAHRVQRRRMVPVEVLEQYIALQRRYAKQTGLILTAAAAYGGIAADLQQIIDKHAEEV